MSLHQHAARPAYAFSRLASTSTTQNAASLSMPFTVPIIPVGDSFYPLPISYIFAHKYPIAKLMCLLYEHPANTQGPSEPYPPATNTLQPFQQRHQSQPMRMLRAVPLGQMLVDPPHVPLEQFFYHPCALKNASNRPLPSIHPSSSPPPALCQPSISPHPRLTPPPSASRNSKVSGTLSPSYHLRYLLQSPCSSSRTNLRNPRNPRFNLLFSVSSEFSVAQFFSVLFFAVFAFHSTWRPLRDTIYCVSVF